MQDVDDSCFMTFCKSGAERGWPTRAVMQSARANSLFLPINCEGGGFTGLRSCNCCSDGPLLGFFKLSEYKRVCLALSERYIRELSASDLFHHVRCVVFGGVTRVLGMPESRVLLLGGLTRELKRRSARRKERVIECAAPGKPGNQGA